MRRVTEMPVSEKIDLYKLHKAEYAAPKTPALVQVKRAKYLAVEGCGEPGGPEFQDRVEALYGAAFTIKMAKKLAGRDYKVCGLEGLWWDMDKPRAEWKWKLVIRTPDFITARDLAAAVAKLAAKGKKGGECVRLETIAEGRCVQALHVGPYVEEDRTMKRMCDFAAAQGVALRGPHHEIYLSDPRRVSPERLRTILRCPVA
jgi:hypothetical protein